MRQRVPDPTTGTRPVRTPQDLQVAVEAMSMHFSTDTVVVVGSQAILVGWPDAPEIMRTSGEIDAYPANAREWEARMNARARSPEDMVEASEDVFSWFGTGSKFEKQWGFYIDGVDDSTARLPPGWQERAVYHEFDSAARGRRLTVVAPSPHDTIVAKLHRCAEKDMDYIRAFNAARPLDAGLLLERLGQSGAAPETVDMARRFLGTLPAPVPGASDRPEMPECPPGSHCRFVSPAGDTVTVRQWDEGLQLFYKVDNPLGPAVVGPGPEDRSFFLSGRRMDEEAWSADPRVEAARPEEPQGSLPPWLVPA